MKEYPKVLDSKVIGSYPAHTNAGGGFVWDEVLEYRVESSILDNVDDSWQIRAILFMVL